MTLIGAGEFPITVGAYLHNTLELQAKGGPVDFARLSPGLIKTSPHIVPQYAPRPNVGRLFMRWLMTPGGQAIFAEIRQKGNPYPGSGTIQSKAVEKLGIKLVTTNVWEIDTERLEKVYQEAVGFKEKKKEK